MIGASIVALSILFSSSDLSRSVVESDATAAFPGIKMPKLPKVPTVSMPKMRLPHLPKRAGSSDAVAQTERRLRTLVAEEERWFAEHGRYDANTSDVALSGAPADSALDRVHVQMLYADRKGWTAMASHPDAPGKSCVIYVGNRNALPMVPRTRTDALDASSAGQPACDR